jgi:ATP-dependent DNA helicase DinG
VSGRRSHEGGEKKSFGEIPAGVERIFAAGGPLSRLDAGYERRPEQVRLAGEVARTLEDNDVLLADCPTGTGKSLGYLVPAVLSGKKVVVSTATIALQHQLLTKDLPLLKKAVCDLGGYPEDEGFTYALMKGRSNFLCENRYDETLRDERMLDAGIDEAALERIDGWRYETETGDREDLPFPVPAGTWMEVASDGEDCAPKSCRFRESCFYYAHRDRAAEADVLVVNHSLLLANAASAGGIFDTGGRHLVLDEAHRIEEIMSSAFGARVTYPRIRYVARQAAKKSASAAQHSDRLLSAADLFFSDLEENQKLGEENEAPRGYRTLVSGLSATRTALANDPSEEANNLQGMVGRLRSDLASFYEDYGDRATTHAHAVMPGRAGRNLKERDFKPYPELRSWLVETASTFRDGVIPLFEDGGVVLASATLATSGPGNSSSSSGSSESKGSASGRSFDYPRRRLGLEDGVMQEREVRELSGPEIFDYGSRCLIYTGGASDEPGSKASGSNGARGTSGSSAAADSDATIRQAEELVRISGGRALILLSTGRAVRAFGESFKTDHPVRYQGEDSPSRLVKWLRETKGAVLVGTRTFWEGVDVPGEALSLVVIDKVPFPPPDDPVIAALTGKAGKNWFREVSLPKAQVAMRQGSGRLLRTATDRGVIALLDPRLNHKNWAKAVLYSLPPAPKTSSLQEVRRFFENE